MFNAARSDIMLTQVTVHVQAPAIGLQVSVYVSRWRNRVNVTDLCAELMASNIRLGHQNFRATVLLIRRQLMAHNIVCLIDSECGLGDLVIKMHNMCSLSFGVDLK
jgi:hypothetical protein